MRGSIRALLPSLASLLLVGCAGGDGGAKPKTKMPTGFLTRTAKLPDGSRRTYSVFVPRGYDPSKRWPTVVFLQGLGEGGTDGKEQTTVGLGPAIRKREKSFGLIAVFPQSGGRWSTEEADDIAMACLDDAARAYKVDDRRVYLTGLSTGGYGTWKIGAAHRDRFAALVPLCGYSGVEFADRLTRTPVWAFHNSLDPFVLSSSTKSTVDAINEKGGDAKVTIYGTIGHDCWSWAYGDAKLWQWLLKQSKA